MKNSFPKELCIPLRGHLHKEDSDNQTFGCRHSNPDICGYCYLEGICAFNSPNNICKHPSAKWKKIYIELKKEESQCNI